MVKTFLLGDNDKKKRGIILSGAPNSGKSTIGRYIAQIFDSHTLKQTNSSFEVKMEKEDANK